MKSPNILFILSDQHHARFMGCAEHPVVKTPHLDRLASEGVRFTNAVCQNPVCTPSRVSFLSGQYAHNHGYYGNEGPSPRGLPTMLGHFRRQGYRTGAIGKIHCPAWWVENDCDEFLEVTGNSIEGQAKARQKYIQDRSLTEHEYGAVTHDGIPEKCGFEDSAEGWIATESIRFMETARDSGKPFILHASFPKPHQPYTPAREFWDLYPEGSYELPASFHREPVGKAPTLLHERARTMKRTNWYVEPKTWEAAAVRKLRGYLGCVSHMDHAVGQLLAFLDQSGLDRDTIVVYSSDHGEYACAHGLMEKAPGICADAVTRIPMIWRVPGFKGGRVAAPLVESVDVTATLCRLAGVDPMETSDGKDLTGLLHGDGKEVRSIAVTEFPFSKSVRKGRHRLVYYPRWFFAQEYPEGFGELYDLEKDPEELSNLWFDPEHQGTVRELESDLLQWLIETSRPATALPPLTHRGPQWLHQYRNSVNADGKFSPGHLRGMDIHRRMRL